MIDCKKECKWWERCDAGSAHHYKREDCIAFGKKETSEATLVQRLRWEAERLSLKFSENDELFQLLTEAADELERGVA